MFIRTGVDINYSQVVIWALLHFTGLLFRDAEIQFEPVMVITNDNFFLRLYG